MTRAMWFGRVIPLLAIVYVVVLIVFHGARVAGVGALVLALFVLIGVFLIRPEFDPDVPRSQRRAQRDRDRRMRRS